MLSGRLIVEPLCDRTRDRGGLMDVGTILVLAFLVAMIAMHLGGLRETS